MFTAYTTVKPLSGARRQVDMGLMVMALLFATLGYFRAVDALGRTAGLIERPGSECVRRRHQIGEGNLRFDQRVRCVEVGLRQPIVT